MKIESYSKIALLNLPSWGSYAAHISTTVDEGGFVEITISDCNKMITLHNNLNHNSSIRGDFGERENILCKVNILIETLTELRTHLISQFEKNEVKYK